MKNIRKLKAVLGLTVLLAASTFVGCTAAEENTSAAGQETETAAVKKETSSVSSEEEKMDETSAETSADSKHQPVQINPSPDKYTWYIKDYVGKNVAAFGYTSMGGSRMDHYGEGYLKLILVNEDGSYIDISNDDDLKNYVVTAQNLEPNTELKYTFMEDESGEEYGSLISYQNIEEIVLAVKEVGSETPAKELTEITVSPDKYTWYIRDYVGRNLSFCGYASLGGELRDAYGASTVVFVIMPDDGSYIEASDEETLKKYVVTGQSVAPNSELKLELLEDENGEEYGSLVESQNIAEIELYVSPVEE